MTDTKREIEKIINKVRTVEFLHGVPVSLPSETVELLRSGIRKAIDQAVAEERARVEKILSDANYELEEWYSSSERPKTLTHFEANQRNMETRTKIQFLLSSLDEPITDKD